MIRNVFRSAHDATCRLWRSLAAVRLRLLVSEVGPGAEVHPWVTLQHASKIRIGADVQLSRGVVLNARSDRDVGIYLSDGVRIKEYAVLDAYGGFIHLGRDVRIGHHSVIAGHGGVTFGDFSGVSGLSYVIAADHGFRDTSTPFVEQMQRRRGISIGKNVWGAASVVITDGVEIGDHAVIGAGSVVRRDVPAYSVVAGNPARVVYRFEEAKTPNEPQ